MESLVLLSALYRSRQNFALSHRTKWSGHEGAFSTSNKPDVDRRVHDRVMMAADRQDAAEPAS